MSDISDSEHEFRLSLSDEPRKDLGEHVSDKTLRALIGEYYTDNPVGGNAHIVFDEGGFEDGNIEFCIKQSILCGDWVCAGLLMELFKRHPLHRKEIIR